MCVTFLTAIIRSLMRSLLSSFLPYVLFIYSLLSFLLQKGTQAASGQVLPGLGETLGPTHPWAPELDPVSVTVTVCLSGEQEHECWVLARAALEQHARVAREGGKG